MQNNPAPNNGPSMGQKISRGFKKLVWTTVLLVVLGTTGVLLALQYINYGDGYRVGTVLKLSRKGMVFKTWEGELSQGFLESSPGADAGVATRVWYFTVEHNDQVIEQINHAIDNNKKVKLFYNEKYSQLPWMGDTRQIVYKVEEVSSPSDAR